MRLGFVFSFALLLAACGDSAAPPEIEVRDAWARAVPQAKGNAAVYMTIRNGGGVADRLVAADSPAAAMTMIHQTNMEGGVMRMRHAADGLEVAPDAELQLKPAGAHVMLMGLKAPLEEGKTVPLTLTFKSTGQRSIEVTITDPVAAGPPTGRR